MAIMKRLPEHRAGMWQKYVDQAEEALTMLHMLAKDGAKLHDNLTKEEFDKCAREAAYYCSAEVVELANMKEYGRFGGQIE